MRPYQEQLARVGRFLNRMSSATTNNLEYEDFLLSFFQNCWHLRDWILRDKNISKRKRQAIKQAIENSAVLAICRCITNRSKHYKLIWPIAAKRKAAGTWKPRRIVRLVGEIKIQIGDSIEEGDSVAVSREYSLKAKNKTYSAARVAQEAFVEWKRILAQNKL